MALVTVLDTDTFQGWKDKSNLLASQVGDLALLATTNKTSIINAINEVKSGNIGSVNVTASEYSIFINGTERLEILSNGTVTLTGSLNVSQNLSSTGNAVVGGALNVTGTTLFNNNVQILSGTLSVGGATTLSSSLAVTGNTTLSGTLNVTGLISGTITNCNRSITPGSNSYLIGGGDLTADRTFVVDATETLATANKVVARDSSGGIATVDINSSGSLKLTGALSHIYQQDVGADSGDAGTGEGKLEYSSSKWMIKSGSDSARIVEFKRGATVASFIGSDGQFNGVATSARFADLAEKYTTDKEYPVGTVMVISLDSASECTASFQPCQLALGVISENPAYLMNSESEGQAIALKGRVPVRVIGAIMKGQPLVATANGTAIFGQLNPIGIALETNLELKEKLVEVAII